MQKRHKILGVDDNATNIAILEELLGEEYILETASSGEEALARATTFQPELVLLDIMMPGIDGYETCRRLRQDPALRHIKIIMVSAKAMLAERLKGYEVGADDYVTKPFDDVELLSKVQVYLRLKSAEEVDQLKSNVLALLGHETRTPLNGLIGPAEMLMSDDDMDADGRKVLAEMIYRNATRLHQLFEKVMMLSALRSGKVDLEMEDADLVEVVRDAVEDIQEAATSRKVKIEATFTESLLATFARTRLRMVFGAILDNAVRFSLEGGSVEIRGTTEDGCCVIAVTDHGKGIAPDFVPHVFDAFTDADTRHHTEGQGLSLAIARHTVELHGGTIDAQSVPGRQTTLSIRLPQRSICDDTFVAGDSVTVSTGRDSAPGGVYT